MALKIRLRQQGRKNRPFYRLVLIESRSPRDGKYLENLGWYNPFEEEAEKNLLVKADRVAHWLDQGAVLSDRAESLVKKSVPAVFETYLKKVMGRQAKACEKKKARRKKKAKA
ncbi:MAG: 30S ribosomal protein S16 [Chlamydiae bacterium]|nr:30S ribosomal protein S16 [Chlamydiota bacterium]